MSPVIAEAVERMTNDEKLVFVDELLVSLGDEDDVLTPAQIAELRRRIAAVRAGEMPLRDWEDVWAEMRVKAAA